MSDRSLSGQSESLGRPRLVDLFCGAGGAGMGYHRAGFDVLGVDIRPQSSYPFAFVQADALTFPLDGFDAIHASPPCQGYLNLGAVNRALGRDQEHERLIAPTRELLIAAGVPYVIENVPDAAAELRNPIRLCGSSFGLAVRRHRLFESSAPIMAAPCAHHLQREPRYWTGWRPDGHERKATVVQVYGNGGDRETWGPAMGIEWMTPGELAEAIPPAYTEHIGGYLLAELRAKAAA
jgi:DNA (cytosine-5)-methyltransferase 1